MVALAAFRADNGRALFYCVFGTGLKRYQRIRLCMAQAALNNEKSQPLVMLTCFFQCLVYSHPSRKRGMLPDMSLPD
jgi:hypothetical protein